jgi:hypothetical protein
VLGQFGGHAVENLEDFQQRQGVAAMDVHHPLRHRMNARELTTQISMVGIDDVFAEFLRREFRRVGFRLERREAFRFQFGNDDVEVGVLALAGLAQRATALTAEIDLKGLEHPRASGTLGDKFADRPVGQCGSWRSDDVGMMCVCHGSDFEDCPTLFKK